MLGKQERHMGLRIFTVMLMAILIVVGSGGYYLAKTRVDSRRAYIEYVKETEALEKNKSANFIKKVAPTAQEVGKKEDLYASIIIAQAIVESSWGQSTLAKAPNYNLFGIKGNYNGKSVKLDTREVLNGTSTTIKGTFRKYPSIKESIEDNAHVIKTEQRGGMPLYSAVWKSNAKTVSDAVQALASVYATEPNYATTLLDVIKENNLTQYDD